MRKNEPSKYSVSLRSIAGISGAAAITQADIKESVCPESDITAVMIVDRLVHFQDDLLDSSRQPGL